MKEKNLFDSEAEILLFCHAFKWEPDQLNPDLLIRLKLLLGSINKKTHWEVIQTGHGYYGNCDREGSCSNKNSFLYSLISLVCTYPKCDNFALQFSFKISFQVKFQ